MSSIVGDHTSWENPGVFPVANGIYRIPLPLPGDSLKAVNIYVIEDGEKLTLIDSGQMLPVAREQLETSLRSIDRDVREIARMLITHLHRDHYTMGVYLRKEFGSQVILGKGEIPSMRFMHVPSWRPLDSQFRLLAICGAEKVIHELRPQVNPDEMPLSHYQDPDLWLDDQSEVELSGRHLKVIATPGHTRGHVVFHDGDNGLLFAGDHVLPHITPSLGFEALPPELPLHDYLDSLIKIRSLPDTQLLPAHGPVVASTHLRIDELLSHHDKRLDATLREVESGRGTSYEVANGLRWTRHERSLSELNPLNQMLAVLETKAHLDILVAQNRLKKSIIDGIEYLQPDQK